MPSGFRRLGLVNDNGVEETLASNEGNERRVHGHEGLTETLSESIGLFHGLVLIIITTKNRKGCEYPFRHLFLLEDLEGGHGNGTAKRITAIRRAMLTRLNTEHHLFVRKDRRDGVHTSRESLSEN